jgi:hypothetical protein
MAYQVADFSWRDRPSLRNYVDIYLRASTRPSFEGALTIHGALQLWRLYMLSPLVDTTLALLFFFWRHCFFTSRDRLFAMLLSSEYTLVHDVLGQNVQIFNWRFGIGNILNPIYVYLLFKADIFDLGNVSLGYMIWVAAQYLSWRVMEALPVAQIVMYG